MNNYEISNPYFEQAQRKHRELRNLLCELGDVMRPQAWLAEGRSLCAPLGRLREFLTSHFAQEEEGGYLDEAVSLVPRLGPQVDALEREHSALRRQLNELIRLAPAAGQSEKAEQQLLAKYGRFVKALRLHEAGEEEVIQAASHLGLDGKGDPGN